MPGIVVRAADRVAVWREAAEGDIGYLKEVPPTEAPDPTPPPMGADDAPEPIPSVTIPNSNKFKTPANGLKKLLDSIPDDDEPGTGPHSMNLSNWLAGHQPFVHTYFKPTYADALKAHIGDAAYAKLTKHAPKQIGTALTTHVQHPAPNSNKFKTPANGLKKLLSQPNAKPEDIQHYLDTPQGQTFAKTYLHNPAYQDAIKSHLGDKAYQTLQKHIKLPAAPKPPKSHAEMAAEAFAPAGFKLKTQDEFFHDHVPEGSGPKNPKYKGTPEPEPADLGYGNEAYTTVDDDEIAQIKQEQDKIGPVGPPTGAGTIGPHHNQYTDPSQLKKNQPEEIDPGFDTKAWGAGSDQDEINKIKQEAQPATPLINVKPDPKKAPLADILKHPKSTQADVQAWLIAHPENTATETDGLVKSLMPELYNKWTELSGGGPAETDDEDEISQIKQEQDDFSDLTGSKDAEYQAWLKTMDQKTQLNIAEEPEMGYEHFKNLKAKGVLPQTGEQQSGVAPPAPASPAAPPTDYDQLYPATLQEQLAQATGTHWGDGWKEPDAQNKAGLEYNIADADDNWTPDQIAAMKKVYEQHYGPYPGGDDQDEIEKVKGAEPLSAEELLNGVDWGDKPSAPAGPKVQHPALAQGIQKIFPDADLTDMGLDLSTMSDDEMKKLLETWQTHLGDTPGLASHHKQITDLYNKFFGPKAQATPQQPAQPFEEAWKTTFGSPGAPPTQEKAQGLVDLMSGQAQQKGQALLDKYFGPKTDQQTPAAPAPFNSAALTDAVFKSVGPSAENFLSLDAQQAQDLLTKKITEYKSKGYDKQALGLQDVYDKFFGQGAAKPANPFGTGSIGIAFDNDPKFQEWWAAQEPGNQKAYAEWPTQAHIKYMKDMAAAGTPVPAVDNWGQNPWEQKSGPVSPSEQLYQKAFPGKNDYEAFKTWADQATGMSLPQALQEWAKMGPIGIAAWSPGGGQYEKYHQKKTTNSWEDLSQQAQAVSSISAVNGVPWSAMSENEIKQNLKEMWDGGHANSNAIKALLDQYAQPIGSPAPTGGSGLTEDLIKQHFPTIEPDTLAKWLQGGDPEKQKAYLLDGIASLNQPDTQQAKGKWQAIYDAAFGADVPTPEWLAKHYPNTGYVGDDGVSVPWTPENIKLWWAKNGKGSQAGSEWTKDEYGDKSPGNVPIPSWLDPNSSEWPSFLQKSNGGQQQSYSKWLTSQNPGDIQYWAKHPEQAQYSWQHFHDTDGEILTPTEIGKSMGTNVVIPDDGSWPGKITTMHDPAVMADEWKKIIPGSIYTFSTTVSDLSPAQQMQNIKEVCEDYLTNGDESDDYGIDPAQKPAVQAFYDKYFGSDTPSTRPQAGQAITFDQFAESAPGYKGWFDLMMKGKSPEDQKAALKSVLNSDNKELAQFGQKVLDKYFSGAQPSQAPGAAYFGQGDQKAKLYDFMSLVGGGSLSQETKNDAVEAILGQHGDDVAGWLQKQYPAAWKKWIQQNPEHAGGSPVGPGPVPFKGGLDYAKEYMEATGWKNSTPEEISAGGINYVDMTADQAKHDLEEDLKTGFGGGGNKEKVQALYDKYFGGGDQADKIQTATPIPPGFKAYIDSQNLLGGWDNLSPELKKAWLQEWDATSPEQQKDWVKTEIGQNHQKLVTSPAFKAWFKEDNSFDLDTEDQDGSLKKMLLDPSNSWTKEKLQGYQKYLDQHPEASDGWMEFSSAPEVIAPYNAVNTSVAPGGHYAPGLAAFIQKEYGEGWMKTPGNKGKDYVDYLNTWSPEDWKIVSEQWNALTTETKQGYQEAPLPTWAGGGGSAASGPPPYDKDAIFAEYAKIWPNTTKNLKFTDAETAKAFLSGQLGKTNYPAEKTEALKALYDKYFGSGVGGGKKVDLVSEIKKIFPNASQSQLQDMWGPDKANTAAEQVQLLNDYLAKSSDTTEEKASISALIKQISGGSASNPEEQPTTFEQAKAMADIIYPIASEGSKKMWAQGVTAKTPDEWASILNDIKNNNSHWQDWVSGLSGNTILDSPPPVTPYDPEGFSAEFKAIYPGSGWADTGHPQDESQAKLKSAVDSALSNFPGTEKTLKAKALYEKYFGPFPVNAPSGGGYTPTPTPPVDLAEQAKINQMMEEESAEPAKPFKSEDLNPDDLKTWTATKPQTEADWKNFSTWWGNTKISPEQEQGLYQTWFSKKATPEQANAWFQQMFEHHAHPTEADLKLTTGVPNWATSSWAFGKNAEKEWPIFQKWATSDPGLPPGTKIKQKLLVWNSLSSSEKAAIADNHLPANPIDTKAVIGELKKAYPDSNWAKWEKMPQGTLRANLENLANSGYDPAIPIFNKYFDGKIPMPEPAPKGEKPKKPKVAPKPPPMIPESEWPEYVKNGVGIFGYGKDTDLKNYTYFQHWAESVGKGDVASGKVTNDPDFPFNYSDYPSTLADKWNGLSDSVKKQVSMMSKPPWKDVAGFDAWVAAQPTLQNEVNQLYPDLGNGSYSWTNPNYLSQQKKMVEKQLEAETDPAKKQALTGIYQKYFGLGKDTLAEALKKAVPNTTALKIKNWDTYLQTHSVEDTAKLVKKLIKNEPNPENFVQLCDIWSKFFPGPAGHKQLSSVLGQGHPGGVSIKSSDLAKLWEWKKNGDPSASLPYYTNEGDNSPYVLKQKEDSGGSLYNKQPSPKYYGWTPPTGVGDSDYTPDPALFASSDTNHYAIPQLGSASSPEYKTLLDSVKNYDEGLFSPKDLQTLTSDSFQNWFNKAPKDYRNANQDHPGTCLDEYAEFMNGGPAYGTVTPGGSMKGKDTYYDLSPFNLIPKPGDKDVSGKPYSKSLTHNPFRDPSKPIRFPKYLDQQETLPLPAGEHWAPHYAPMPIYRIIPNSVLDLDGQPSLSSRFSQFPPAVRAHMLEEQRWRLRRIDQIINGPNAQRNVTEDRKRFEDWASSHNIPPEQMKSVGAELFSTQPTLSSDEKWKYFEDWASKHGVAQEDMYDLASKVGIGNPGQGLPNAKSNYEHPELANLILDYLENGAHGGLGIHWTRDKHKLYNGISSAGVGKNTLQNVGGRQIPILLSGLWGGQGEGQGEGGAYDVMNDQEREHNLKAGAPVLLRRLQIRDEKGDFHDLVDPGPISMLPPGRDETVAGGSDWKDRESLAARLTHDLGGSHDAKFWDTLQPGLQADQAFRKLFEEQGLLEPNGQWVTSLSGKQEKTKENLLKAYKQWFVGKPHLAPQHHRFASVPLRKPIRLAGTSPTQLYGMAREAHIPDPERYGRPYVPLSKLTRGEGARRK